jgi:IQ calmodulin-binding motif
MSDDLYNKIIQLNTQGMHKLNTGDYLSSLMLLKKAESLCSPSFIPRYLKTLIFFSLASYYQVSGSRRKALECLESIFNYTQDNLKLAKVHLNIAKILSSQGNHSKSLYHNTQALKYLQNTDQWDGIVSAYHSIGLDYQNLNKINKAIDSFKTGLMISKSHLGTNHKLTRLLRNTYLEENKNYVRKSFYKGNKGNVVELSRVVQELENPVYYNSTPVPARSYPKQSLGLNKPVGLTRSFQYEVIGPPKRKVIKQTPEKLAQTIKTPDNKYRIWSISHRNSIIPRRKIDITTQISGKLVTQDDRNKKATTIQKYWKMAKQKNRFKDIIKKIVKIQAAFRAFLSKKH